MKSAEPDVSNVCPTCGRAVEIASRRIGSVARPRTVRGTRMPSDCLWDTCDGLLTGQSHNRYMCSTCETWFELLPPTDMGVYVGDLGDLNDQIAAKWVM